MKTHPLALAAALLALSASAGLAATSDVASHTRADRFAPGKHQFYAWCANGQDRLVSQDGISAEDARSKLATEGCRLAWQGRIRP
jgi:hypothetical protein